MRRLATNDGRISVAERNELAVRPDATAGRAAVVLAEWRRWRRSGRPRGAGAQVPCQHRCSLPNTGVREQTKCADGQNTQLPGGTSTPCLNAQRARRPLGADVDVQAARAMWCRRGASATPSRRRSDRRRSACSRAQMPFLRRSAATRARQPFRTTQVPVAILAACVSASDGQRCAEIAARRPRRRAERGRASAARRLVLDQAWSVNAGRAR